MISFGTADIGQVKNAYDEAYNNYKSNLQKLNGLIQDITAENIKGQPADKFKALYDSKESTFKSLETTLDAAKEEMDRRGRQAGDTIGDIQSTMK